MDESEPFLSLSLYSARSGSIMSTLSLGNGTGEWFLRLVETLDHTGGQLDIQRPVIHVEVLALTS